MSPSTQDDNSGNRRTPTGILIRPRQQFRYSFTLVAGGIIAQSMVIGIMSFFITATVRNILESQALDPMVGSTIVHTINITMAILLIVAIAFALVAVLIGVKLSHRIYGPMVPFSRHIEQLKEGNYRARMNLRKKDDLIELKDALNSLAETLESKYGHSETVDYSKR